MNKFYQSAEDFFSDMTFQSFVLRKDQEAVGFWEEWIKAHPGKAEEIKEAILMIEALQAPEEGLPEDEFQLELQKIQSYLEEHPSQHSELKIIQFKPHKPVSWWQYAAVFAGLLLLGAFGFWALPVSDFKMASYRTGTEEKLRIELPDNSIVYLNSNSTLQVAKNWEAGTQREVWLKGEAFFNVKHGPAIGTAKFSVNTAGAKVEVLGTQFNVYERADQTKVVLSSGEIKLKLKEKEQAMVLQPGEMVEFSQASRAVTRKQVKPQLYTSWKESQVVFDETPLREIIILVENSFGVQVKVEDDSLLERKMTFKLQENDLDLLLEAMAKTFNLQVKKQADQVTIKKISRNP
ncbi:hypothetical protein BH24BAC1_BH24BAC1_16530 [soil metagenome]